jgi:hypothetical protein
MGKAKKKIGMGNGKKLKENMQMDDEIGGNQRLLYFSKNFT